MKVSKLKLGQIVYHSDIYWGREEMKIVGLRETQVELEGDYSGGTHLVNQKEWHPIDGILLTKNEVALVVPTPTPTLTIQELRIGNILKLSTFAENPIRRIKDVIGYNFNTERLEIDAVDVKHYEPIVLTVSILEKCGFTQEGSEAGDDGAMELISNPAGDEISFLWAPTEGQYTDKDALGMWLSRDNGNEQFKVNINIVHYLHQLQNLYFALLGRELPIKEL